METTVLRSDKKKQPDIVKYELLSNNDCRNLIANSYCYILDSDKKAAKIKITSVKTWKRNTDIIVHCKYGLYEYFEIRITDNNPNEELIRLIGE
jgi:hypothetical protein